VETRPSSPDYASCCCGFSRENGQTNVVRLISEKREDRRKISAHAGLIGNRTEGRYRFPQKEKLKRRNQIQEVFSRRKGVSCAGARLLMLQNGLSYNRIAFTFSRKYGTSVERNHSRRLSREVYRLLRNDLKKGYDLVLHVNPGRDVFSIRMQEMRDLFTRSGLYKPPAALLGGGES